MTVDETLRSRRSIRHFKSDPIPKETIESILDLARWSPSWGNTQPWQFTVITGEPLEAFKTRAVACTLKGEAFHPDITMPSAWPEELKYRYNDIGRRILEALGIDRADREARYNHYTEMARLFGAPCLIVLTLPREISIAYAMLDMGIVIQSICLAAVSRGLGSCIMAASVGYPDLLREIKAVGNERLIVMGIALGYTGDHPINCFTRERAALKELVHWIG